MSSTPWSWGTFQKRHALMLSKRSCFSCYLESLKSHLLMSNYFGLLEKHQTYMLEITQAWYSTILHPEAIWKGIKEDKLHSWTTTKPNPTRKIWLKRQVWKCRVLQTTELYLKATNNVKRILDYIVVFRDVLNLSKGAFTSSGPVAESESEWNRYFWFVFYLVWVVFSWYIIKQNKKQKKTQNVGWGLTYFCPLA